MPCKGWYKHFTSTYTAVPATVDNGGFGGWLVIYKYNQTLIYIYLFIYIYYIYTTLGFFSRLAFSKAQMEGEGKRSQGEEKFICSFTTEIEGGSMKLPFENW